MAKLIELGPGPVNEAERYVVQLLAEGLPDIYRVFPNLTFRDRKSGQSYEYDIIVVTGHAVYVVEIKGWRGRIRAVDRRDWQLSSGRFVRNPLPLNDHKCRVLAGHLRDVRLGSLRTPFVYGCLALGSDNVTLELSIDDSPRCLVPSKLCAFLRDPSHLPNPADANVYTRHIETLARYIEGTLEARSTAPRIFASYQVTSVVEQTDEHAIYLARHAEFDDDRIYRIRSHAVSHYRFRPEERERRLKALRRSAESLHRIGDHPNILSLRAYGDTEDGFFEVTDWSDAGTLATTRSLGTLTTYTAVRRLDIMCGIARALAAAHAHGVHHRDVRPDAVLLGPDGEPRLGNFDLAFIEDATQTVYGASAVRAVLDHPYRAPELRDPAAYDVFESTDFYALGRIAYDLFADYQPDERPDGTIPRLHDVAPLPAVIREPLSELVARLVVWNPNERWGDADEIVASLEHIRDQAARAVEPESSPTPSTTSSASSPDTLAPGDQVADCRIIELMGQGATARVYRVEHLVLGEEMALELARPDADPDGPERAFRLLRRIQHPHVVRALWVGRLPASDPSRATPGPSYLLRELIHGESLAQVLGRGPLPPERALAIFAQLAGALATVHKAGIVHRDVKPGNIMLAQRGAVLADFGTAVLADETNATPVGTPRYTPPELHQGTQTSAHWDARADVFALGCIAYEMLAGGPPWDQDMPSVERPARAWPSLPAIGAEVMSVLRRAMAARQDERYADGTALYEALQRAVERDHERTTSRGRAGATQRGTPAAERPGAAELVVAGPWSASWVEALCAAEDLLGTLYSSLRSHAYARPAASEQDFVDAEARAFALESPLAEILASAYNALLEPTLPWQPGAAEFAPAHVDLGDADRVLVLDGLWLGDIAWVERCATERGYSMRERVWTAGAVDPAVPGECTEALAQALRPRPDPVLCSQAQDVARAFAEGARVAQLALPMGAPDQSLDDVLQARQNLLSTCMDAAFLHAGQTVWVTATWGVIYLGHGLRRDVGEGARAPARIRRAWTDACPRSRLGRGGEKPLQGPVYRPYRQVGERVMPVGRLAWPDASDAPRLACGGLSLPERLLPLLQFDSHTV